LFIVIVCCKKVDEARKSGGATPGGLDALTPFHDGARVDAPAGDPALDVIEGDAEIIWMLLQVRGNTPPAAGAVFATEVGVGEYHRALTLCASLQHDKGFSPARIVDRGRTLWTNQ
jgi:hypothetical protein